MTVLDSKIVSPIGISLPSRTVARDIYALSSLIRGLEKVNLISGKLVTISAGWGVESISVE